MKKTAILFAALILLISFFAAGCGNQNATNTNAEATINDTQDTNSEAELSAQEEPAPETPQIKITEKEAAEALLEVYKQISVTAGVDKEAFSAFFTDDTSGEFIDHVFNQNVPKLDDYDGYDLSIVAIDGNKVYGNIFLYFVSGSGVNASTSSYYMWLALVKNEDGWKISNSPDIQNWIIEASNIVFSEEARDLPASLRWHNLNPSTISGFVIPGAYLAEPKELYYTEDGGLVYKIFFSNGLDRNITVNQLHECIVQDAELNLLLDLSNTRINVPLKPGTSSVHTFTLSPEEVKQNSDLTKGIAWNLVSNYTY